MKVAIIAFTLSNLVDISRYESILDAVEVRFDTFSMPYEEVLHTVRKHLKLPIIATLRSTTYGGGFSGDPYELLKLDRLQPDYIDIEHDVPDTVRLQINQPMILSYHNCHETPEDLEAVRDMLYAKDATYYKMACTCASSLDAMRLLLLMQNEPALTTIGMGSGASFTRILAPIFGNKLEFISCGQKSAPGQLDIHTLLQLYNLQTIDTETKVYALLGDPVDKSHSERTHNHVLHTLQLHSIYVKIRVTKEELPQFLDMARFLPFYGFSLTMPLKQVLSSSPVNTLRNSGASWDKHNTDGVGALCALERREPIKEKTILVLGAGGVSHAIAREALKRGAFVKIANRSLDNAKKLSKALGSQVVVGSINDQHFCNDYDILINGTPLGMGDGKLPLPHEWILPGTLVFDTISNPVETPLLVEAEKMECSLIRGTELFILQAVEQFVFWFPELENEKGHIEQLIRSTLSETSFLAFSRDKPH